MSSYDESEEIERAKREIHDFLGRLEQLAHGDTSVGEFFGFLRQEMHRLMDSARTGRSSPRATPASTPPA